MSSRPPIPTPPKPPSGGSSQRRLLALIPIVGGLFLLLVAALVVFVLVIPKLLPSEEIPGTELPVTKVAVTPTPTDSPVVTPPPAGCQTVISSDDVRISASFPITLAVGDVSFPVETVVPTQAGWDYPSGSSGAAAWVCGTVVNYILELEPTAENEALLVGLRPGDELRLFLSNDVVLVFQFSERQEGVAADAASVFEQVQPRLTLLLREQAGTWKVTSGGYIALTGAAPPPSDQLPQPGQSVRGGDVAVVVSEGYGVRGSDLAAGMMYYLVEFSIENVGSSSLNADTFDMHLQDGVGNVYLLSPAASALGESGLLRGQIAAGTTSKGTAGYVVPEALTGPTLVWTLSPGPDSEARVSIGIPYEGQEEPVEPAEARVYLYDAFLSSDDNSLILELDVENIGGAALTVEADDIILSSSAGMSDLMVVAPPLPWTVEPGETREVEFIFEKPNAPSAVLMLLGHSFEISGLQP
jgi:hypothetical protein